MRQRVPNIRKAGPRRVCANAPQEKMRPQSPTPLTLQQKEKFLTLLRATGNVARSAEACGHDRGNFYALRQPAANCFDPEFTKRWDDAMESYYDDLEEEGFRRAFGEQVPVRNRVTGKQLMVKDENGNLVPLTKKVASDLLLIFMLKGNRKKYVDRTAIEGGATPMAVISTQVKQALMAKIFPHLDQAALDAPAEPPRAKP